MKRTKRRVTKNDRTASAVITLKKTAERRELPPQAFAILRILKAKGGALGTDELKKTMQTKVDSVQPMARIWAFYKTRLVRKGFISVTQNKPKKGEKI